MPLPDTYFHLGGGGFGGPMIKNRTFFWFSVGRLRVEHHPQRLGAPPDRRERAGDFSQSFNAPASWW